MGVFKKKLSGDLVVFFVEGSTGYKNADGHYQKFT
jgi:hypothetical protein